MKFLPLATAVLSATHAAALSSKDITHGIDDITALSSQAEKLLKELSPVNLSANLPAIYGNLTDLVNVVVKDIRNVGASASVVPNKDQQDICHALAKLLQAQKSLATTVSGKESVLPASPLSGALVSIIKILQGVVDNLAASVVGTAPTCKEAVAKALQDLGSAFDQTIVKLSDVLSLSASLGLGGLANVKLDLGVKRRRI
ncbi:uncharacterized protein UV8b_04802 [Ustilaginoidea virens]|uniref:Cell wall galactomannoprotein n=1 Tax=Ustilaginoidea virens TaxID=1159556 RepID=A0A063BR43_USTVR|nr:uncharacterized protein UV8b_04802 [Ustilaginoidea virens]QUC20561.1 hypothetical protein UV8b_04802 [Ustilaginoidea virens]GAO15625.1 hypothetical protein UVI_02050570 [Ustilaginoidea virens]